MKRREFLRQTAAAAATLSCFPATLSAVEREITPGQLERRALGQTGEKLSIVAFGGFVLNRATPEQAAAWIREAFEAGVNHFDVAPEYGTAEERMGPALEPYRKRVFLSCKTGQRRQAQAAAELDRSLQRLRTDHFDLYQFHHVTRLDEVETIFGDDGAMKAFEKARKDGKARFLGFSAHSVEAALAMLERFAFESIMFPVNYATWTAGNFGPQVLAKAQEKKAGILALKALARRPWPRGADRAAHPNCWYEPMSDPEEARLGLGFTLSHPVTTALMPASEPGFKLGLKAAARFAPLQPEEIERMKQKGLAAEPLFKYRGNG
jgi:aryl-alcohol dehydrogenase-like predicted oxidoreductase